MLSTLFTVNVQVPVLLEASLPLIVMVIGPEPETTVPAIGLCVLVIDKVEVQLSLNVARPV